LIDYPPLEKDMLPVKRLLRNLLSDCAAAFVVAVILAWSVLR